MRWPAWRLRVRTLMITVAAVAISIAGYRFYGRMQSRLKEYRNVIAFNADQVRLHQFWIDQHGPRGKNDWEPELIQYYKKWLYYHMFMKQKYEHYATRPWEAVPPDPRQPDED